jgi:hypothetical protein
MKMDQFKLIIDWALSHDTPYDWDIWNLGLTEKDIPDISDWRIFPKFNQWVDSKITSHACTLVWWTRDYCYQYNIPFDKSLMESVVNYAVANHNYVIGKWYRSWPAMEVVRKFFGKWNHVRLTQDDPLFYKVLERKNALWLTYRWNYAWNVDSSDWELSYWKYDPTTYWHRTSLLKYGIDDSYDWTKWNIYTVPYLSRLINGINIYPTFYLWIPEVKNELEVKDLQRRISIFDIAISRNMDTYREMRDSDIKAMSNNLAKDRTELLAFVWDLRRRKQFLVDQLKATQK